MNDNLRQSEGRMTDNGWSDEEVEILREMVGKGASMRMIGDRVGRTRNAVIGKKDRLGIKGPNSERINPLVKRNRREKSAEKPKPRIKRDSVYYVEAVIVPEGERRGLLDRLDNQCCFPIGDPLKEDFHYCNREREDGKSYCAHHGAVMHGKRKAQSRRVQQDTFEPSK